MPYKFNGTDLTMPLAVESIRDWIEEKKKEFNIPALSNEHRNELRAELYRDVLIVVRSRAGHAIDLATEALKLEEILL